MSLLLCAGLTGASAVEEPAGKPNFLVILLDDGGWRDAGFAGNTFIETPHLDRLAGEGVIFSNAYATHAFCAPSRQSMVTGQWPARTAWMQRDELKNRNPQFNAPPFSRAGSAAWSKRIPEFTSLAQALKQAGYATAHIGKSHVHFKLSMRDMGFDYAFGDDNMVGAVKDFFAPYEGLPGKVEAPAGEYLTDRLTAEAIQFIGEHRDQPWFLQLWHYAPHTPIQAPEAVVEKYRKKREALGDPNLNPTYAAMMDVVDQGVGRILEKLGEWGIADNTVILFASDNGGVASLGSVPVTSMAPLRGHKQLTYEGGLRVPMFIHRPGMAAAGKTFDHPVTIMDFFPTMLDLAGVAPPSGQAVDGASLRPALETASQPELKDRPLFWYNVTAGFSDSEEMFQPVAAVRRGNWRLVKNFFAPIELYDLESDVSESVNFASRHPEVVAELESLLDAWLADTGIALPTPNPNFDPDYVIARQIPQAEVPAALEEVRRWDFTSGMKSWRATRMIKTESMDGSLRMINDGLYPEMVTNDVQGLPAGVYYLELNLKVPTSGRIRAAWNAGEDRGNIEFFPQRNGHWHTLTGSFEAKAALDQLRLAAPTHLHVTGHFDPATQPDYIEVKSIRLLKKPTSN